MLVQYADLVRKLLRRSAREVPVVGVFRGNSERPLLSAASDQEGRSRALEWLRLATRALEPIVLAVKRRRLLREERVDDLAGLVELIEALLPGEEFDAVGARFLLVPTGASSSALPS